MDAPVFHFVDFYVFAIWIGSDDTFAHQVDSFLRRYDIPDPICRENYELILWPQL